MRRASVILVACCASLAGAPAFADEIDCEAVFTRDATHETIAASFGADNVKIDDIPGAEGEVLTGTIVYPDDPNRRLQVAWQDEAMRDPIVMVTERSGWRVGGVKIGLSLAELEALNGGPFELLGFDWDYGGGVVDWRGGRLGEPLPGGCALSVTLARDDSASDEAANKVSGDQRFSSDSADMRAVKPVVVEIVASHPVE
jgi:hypothetical protein